MADQELQAQTASQAQRYLQHHNIYVTSQNCSQGMTGAPGQNGVSGPPGAAGQIVSSSDVIKLGNVHLRVTTVHQD